MQFILNYTEKNILEAAKFAAEENKQPIFLKFIINALVAAIFIWALISPQTIFQIVEEALICIYFLILLFLPKYFQKRYARTLHNESPSYNKPMQFDLTENNFKIKGATFNDEILWEGVIKAKYNNVLLLWFIGPFNFYIFPKEAMEENDWNQLLELTYRKIKEVTNKSEVILEPVTR